MWDPSTSTHPTLTGFLSHFLTAHVSGGQTFDRPTSALLVKQVGVIMPPGPRDDSSFSLRSHVPSSLLYLIQIPWIWICLPLLDLLRALQAARAPKHSSPNYTTYSTGRYRSASNNNNNNNGINRREHGSFHRFLQTTVQYVNSFWISYGPSLQFLLPVVIFGYYSWCIGGMIYEARASDTGYKKYSSMSMSAQPQPSHVYSKYTSSSSSSSEQDGQSKPYGAYRKMEQPSFAQVWFYFTMFGTVASIVFFSRVTLPIPDQVAGSNAIKDLRNEARAKSSKTTRGSSSSGSGSSGGGSNKDNQDAVWTEHNRSVQTENRVRLTLQVGIIRLLDNLLVCGILPRTSYACRATGHCPAGAQIWQLSKVLYPAGITSPLRKDGAYGTAFALLAPDPVSALWTILGVTVATGVLLLVQAISLNKAYLAIMGYICAGEWTSPKLPGCHRRPLQRRRHGIPDANTKRAISFSTLPAADDHPSTGPRPPLPKGDLMVGICMPHMKLCATSWGIREHPSCY
jgi:hypothetical protein